MISPNEHMDRDWLCKRIQFLEESLIEELDRGSMMIRRSWQDGLMVGLAIGGFCLAVVSVCFLWMVA